MIIHQPEIESRGPRVRVSARVEFQTPDLMMPERLWIEYPAEFTPCVRGDAFAVALLLVAMRFGEPLEIRAPLCPTLAYGLEQYQAIWLDNSPAIFRRSEIIARDISRAESNGNEGSVWQPFSGGVDSFFTLRQHVPGGRLHRRLALTHAMFVHGFDVPLHDMNSLRKVEEAYGPLLRDLGVCPIFIRTNLREMTKDVNWEDTHGSGMVAMALALGPQVRALLIPGTFHYKEPKLWGSDPRLDHWLGVGHTGIIHFGSELIRLEKLHSLLDWEPARQGLRVCWEQPDGIVNCCRCLKCVTTSTVLQAARVLESFETFPLSYDRSLVRRPLYADDFTYSSGLRLLSVVQKCGNPEVERDVERALELSRSRMRRNKILKLVKRR